MMFVLLVVAFFLTIPESEPAETFLLFDFGNQEHAQWWSITNDDVMGGVSEGQWDTANEFSVFSGTVSLESNGGFSSVRTEFRPLDLSNADGIQLMVRGDGQRYSFNLRDIHSWLSYRATFETALLGDDWQRILIPFDELMPNRFGTEIPSADTIDLENVWSMSILISDEQAGDFRLEILDLSLYREEAQGSSLSLPQWVDV